jgi:DNA primase
VDGEKGLFYCFGCQTGGDSFKFLMLREGMDFAEAAQVLGERLGLKPPERKSQGSDRRRRVYEVNTAAAAFFGSCLKDAEEGKAARHYLDGRGVGQEIRKEFEIGYAPGSWERLRSHLGGRGYNDRTGIEAGLLVDRDGRSVYDRFRNRIVFPIRSLGGEVVAFGGRTLDPKEPAKYINSPESPVYIKGEVLYGLDRARSAIREKKFAVLVEGYLDLIGLAAGGFRNVVATLGTALTASQARLLRRYTERIVINYDADEAGRNAAHRALEILLGMDFAMPLTGRWRSSWGWTSRFRCSSSRRGWTRTTSSGSGAPRRIWRRCAVRSPPSSSSPRRWPLAPT